MSETKTFSDSKIKQFNCKMSFMNLSVRAQTLVKLAYGSVLFFQSCSLVPQVPLSARPGLNENQNCRIAHRSNTSQAGSTLPLALPQMLLSPFHHLNAKQAPALEAARFGLACG